MFRYFLLYSKVIQLCIDIYSFLYSFHCALSQDVDYVNSPLCYYGRTLLFICCLYNSLYWLIPNSQHFPSPHALRLGNHESVFCKSKERTVKSLSHIRLCNPTDSSLPGSSVREIFQARILKRIAISFSRRSSQPRD